MTSPARQRVAVQPITPSEVPAVARFLHENLNARVSIEAWTQAMRMPWQNDAPNAGFMLTANDAVVGVNLAFYADREIDGRFERFCNLGAWCVRPEYRIHAFRLLRALLAQDDFHFTDLSPSGSVVDINTRLGFRLLDTTTRLMPNLPWPPMPGEGRVSSEPEVLRRALQGRELRYYLDHAEAPAAQHLLLTRGERSCYVMFRRDRRKGLPLFASMLHVSDPELFISMARPLGRHLLVRERVPATLLERVVVPMAPGFSVQLRSSRPKMFRSDALTESQIDLLYSELVCLPW